MFNFGIGRLVENWGFHQPLFLNNIKIGRRHELEITNQYLLQARETPLHSITAHQSAVKAVSWCPWQSNVLATAGRFQESVVSEVHFPAARWNSG